MPNIMIIFGSGASYDAIPKSKKSVYKEWQRMPLSNSLFADYGIQNTYLNEYGVVRIADIIRSIVESGGQLDLEKELDSLKDRSNRIFALNKELFVLRYYLKCVIEDYTEEINTSLSRRTNYVTLLNHLQEVKGLGTTISLASFNYDLLLESALELTSERWKSDSDSFSNYFASSGRDFNLYKLHGSIDWGWQLPADWAWDTNEDTIINRWDQVFLDDCKLVRTNLGDTDSLIPAISLPFRTKTTFSMPQSMMKSFNNDLKEVECILAIGWKAGDTHFVDALKKQASKLKRIAIVTPDKMSYEIARDNLSSLENVRFRLIDKEFCDFVNPVYVKYAMDYLQAKI